MDTLSTLLSFSFGETRVVNQLKGQVVQSFYGFFVVSQDEVWHNSQVAGEMGIECGKILIIVENECAIDLYAEIGKMRYQLSN